MENIRSAVLRNKKVFIIIIAACIFAALFGAAFAIGAAGADDVEYIYFDLAAGSVSVKGSTYSGTVYQKDAEGSFTAVAISGTIQENQAYYVYQSAGGAAAPDGYRIDNGDGSFSFVLPERAPVTVGTESWADYVTNNSNVEAVIGQWITSADEAQRTSTKNTVSVTGQVNATIVIDNIWSSYHLRNTSRSTGGFSFYPNSSNSHLRLELKGDNRVGNLYFGNANTTSSLTIDENKPGATLTAANLAKNSSNNYWCSAIGSSDSGMQDTYGLIFNGGTIFAGTNAGDDCTAIGGGGNGTGIITINGGRVTAAVTSSGAAIGGGIGKTANGGKAEVYINGGEVYAYNFSCSSGTYSQQGVAYIPSAAIGGGSSARAVCDACTVKIMGGKVYAQSVGGTAIGGGSSADNTGGSATVTIGGNAYVEAKSVAGTINGNAVPAGVSIGGGTGGKAAGKNGGNVTLTIQDNPTVIVGSIGGGKTISPTGKLGSATVKVSGGTIQGQIIMAAGASTRCSLDMSGGTIDNSAKDDSFIFLEENGGAIYMNDPNGIAQMSGGSILNCSAANGGALYMTAGSFTLSGTGTIKSCSATESGGAVFMGGGTLQMDGGTLSGNAAVNGAAAYLLDGTMTVSGGTVSDNEATVDGGAAYLGGGAFNVEGGAITRNIAVDGAGAYVANGTLTVSDGSLDNNVASDAGGAAYLGGGDMIVSGGTISNNSAVNGAGAYVENGTLTVSGGALDRNVASNAGGAAYLGGGEMLISGGTISNNSAVNGAGAYILSGALKVTKGSIESNKATESGGGAYLAGGSLTVSNGNITKNTAVNGAGAYVANGNVTVSGGLISENVAEVDGGAFSITNGNYVMKGGVLDLNRAETGDGGAIYISSSEDNAEITVYSGSITNNSAGKNGGALGVHGRDGVELTITIGSKTNHAGKDDAHECIDDPGIDEPCPVVSGNISAVSGGGIYLSGSYQAVMNMYCLIENGNIVGDGASPSNFMNVEGGTLNITTTGDGTQQDHGNVVINSSIHVTGGNVVIKGTGANPMFKESVTVDVNTEQNSKFTDLREGGEARTIQYFENFEKDGETSGQYVLIDFPSTEPHEVRGSMYSITGYAMEGWILMEVDSEGNHIPTDRVVPAGEIITDTGNLIFYAKWTVVGYTVVFKPGVDKYEGKMDPQGFDYSESKALNANAFINAGYTFVHWVDESDSEKVYTDGQVISGLSNVHGTKINLVAVWQICDHTDMDSYKLTHNGSSATRQCPCMGYSETASIIAVNEVYDGTPHGTSIRYDRKTQNGLKPTVIWELSLFYNGTSNGGDVLVNATDAPTDAGNYTADVKVTDTVSLSVTVFIDRAERETAPDNPEYTTEIDDNGTPDNKNDDVNVIMISDPYAALGSGEERIPLEYQFSWYTGTSLNQSIWLEWNDTDPPMQELSVAYTNYYVDVRYKETPNYKASDIVRGTSVVVWTGNVIFEFTSGNGLSHSHVTSDQSDGITVTLTPTNGYYIYDPRYEMTGPDGYTLPSVNNETVESSSWVLWIHDIEKASSADGVTVEIVFSGAERLVTVDSQTSRDETFGSIKNSGEDSVTVSRDSAYTAYFAIKNYRHYTAPAVAFDHLIPAGTSIIMIDLSDSSYWSYVATTAVGSVLLEDFVRMGTESDCFSVGAREALELQFIVDFSDCAEYPATNQLVTSITATPVQLAGLNTVPSVPSDDGSVSSVTLGSTPTFSVEKDYGAQDSSLSQGLTYKFANLPFADIGASAWKNIGGILVFESTDPTLLPLDAKLRVTIGNSTVNYSLIDGKFIVALDPGRTDASFELCSDMLPNENVTFVFNVTLHASETAVRTTPTAKALNVGTLTVDYSVKKVLEPSVNAEINGDLPKYDGNDITDLDFTVYVQDLGENDKIVASLDFRDEYGAYSFTTRSIELDTSSNVINASLSLATFEEGMRTSAGSLSFRLRIEVKDSMGDVIDQIPLYFILIDAR